MKYLLVNNNDVLPYKERFKLFSSKDRALGEFESLGGELIFGLSDKIGKASVYRCGDIYLMIIPIEEQ